MSQTLELACRALHEVLGTGDADSPMHAPYQKSWEDPELRRWEQWKEAVETVLSVAALSQNSAEAEGPLWQKLRDLFGLDGWHDGQWQGVASKEQIVTHIEYVAMERARLLHASLPKLSISGGEPACVTCDGTGSVLDGRAICLTCNGSGKHDDRPGGFDGPTAAD